MPKNAKKKRSKTLKKGTIKKLMDKDSAVKKIDQYIKKKHQISLFEKTYLKEIKALSDNGSDVASPKSKSREILT